MSSLQPATITRNLLQLKRRTQTTITSTESRLAVCHLAAGEISCPTRPAMTWHAITRVNTKRSAQRQLTLTAWVHWRILRKCGGVQLFQNDGHKSKAHSDRTQQKNNFKTSLSPFCSAASVIQVSHLKR